MAIPKRVADRLAQGLKRFQPILNEAKIRDVGEADTVTIIKDMLEAIFGYCKYNELTSEHSIRGTYCDLAIKIDGVLQSLIEVKAIGSALKDSHVKQAVDYAANQGVDWVALTNGIQWKVYKVLFAKPIEHELVVDIDISNLNSKKSSDLEVLYLWCKEGWVKSVVGEYYEQKQSLSRYYIAAAILSDSALKSIRQELRRLSPKAKISAEQIEAVIVNEVLKREVLEGEKAEQAKSKLARVTKKALKSRQNDKGENDKELVEAAIDSVQSKGQAA